MKKTICTLLIFVSGCGSGDESGVTMQSVELGGNVAAVGGTADDDNDSMSASCLEIEGTCDDASGRALACSPYRCSDGPQYYTVTGTSTDRDHIFDIFTYEASHPTATATEAFPCAETHQAAAVTTEACSRANVMPWHSVIYTDAEAACTSIGWRLCTRDEMLSACQGPSRLAYPYGSSFDAGKCNVNAVRGALATTGEFEECQSTGGGYDLTGNLWEWTSRRDPSDPRSRYYQGAGWKIVAERHQATELRCETDSKLPAFTASSFAASHVGFRCCRSRQE